MNKRKIENPEAIILSIQNALSETAEARFYHRLHLVMLAVNGMPVKQIADLYNESITTIEYWTKHVVEQGVDSLRESKHTGRPSKISEKQLKCVEQDLLNEPSVFGYDMSVWDGVLLKAHLETAYQISVSVRHCQRLMRKLGFSLQRPQTIPSGGSQEERTAFKKN